MAVFDPVVTVLDRLHAAHDAARCVDMKVMWAAKIRQYQRKLGGYYEDTNPDVLPKMHHAIPGGRAGNPSEISCPQEDMPLPRMLPQFLPRPKQ